MVDIAEVTNVDRWVVHIVQVAYNVYGLLIGHVAFFAGWSWLEFYMASYGRQCPVGSQSNSGQSARSCNGSSSSSANHGARFTSLPSVRVLPSLKIHVVWLFVGKL